MTIFLKSTFLLLILTVLYSCDRSPKKAGEISDYIPEGVSIVFKIEDMEALKSDIDNNGFISQLKDTAPYTFFSKKNLFKYLNPSSKSLLCISEIDNVSEVTFITKQEKELFILDSIPNTLIETIPYKKQSFQKITINEQTVFTAIKDSVFIASSSPQILQKLLEGQTEKDPTFNKILSLKKTQDFTTIVPVNEILVDQLLFNFASWAALDIEILPDALTASGVVLAQDSVPQLISVFKDLQPQHNDIAKVTPTEALTVVSFTFNDFEIFQKNLQKFRGIKGVNSEETLLFESVTEVGKITLPQGNAIVLKSIDPELTNDALKEYRTPTESFKNVLIYDFSNPDIFTNHFLTFTNKTNPKVVFKLDNFFIFSENKEVTQQIITAYLNNYSLSNTAHYKEALSQLSDESSLLVIKLNGNYSGVISNLLKSDIGNVSFNKYPLAILQFSYDRDFAHVNFVCKAATAKKQAKNIGKVSQIASIKFENELLGDPVFFSNHRTGGKDIVIQDVTNKLYFISASGKTLW